MHARRFTGSTLSLFPEYFKGSGTTPVAHRVGTRYTLLSILDTAVDQRINFATVAMSERQHLPVVVDGRLIPIVRRLFEDKFSPDRLRSGGELTSVARGLALRALMR